MKVKTSELTSAALDWAVAKCEGVRLEHGLTDDERYSTEWAQGGPIVEREGIGINSKTNDHSLWAAGLAYPRRVMRWSKAELVYGYCLQRGPTPLIAAMRCYVESRLSDEVEIPEEFLS